jgi:hypothetical protein
MALANPTHIYIRCTYGFFGLDITNLYGVYIRIYMVLANPTNMQSRTHSHCLSAHTMRIHYAHAHTKRTMHMHTLCAHAMRTMRMHTLSALCTCTHYAHTLCAHAMRTHSHCLCAHTHLREHCRCAPTPRAASPLHLDSIVEELDVSVS